MSSYAATTKRTIPIIKIDVSKIISNILERKKVVAGTAYRSRHVAVRSGFDDASSRQSGVDGVERALDVEAQGCYRRDAHDGDQADEQTIFDEGRALFVLDKASNQLTHY